MVLRTKLLSCMKCGDRVLYAYDRGILTFTGNHTCDPKKVLLKAIKDMEKRKEWLAKYGQQSWIVDRALGIRDMQHNPSTNTPTAHMRMR